MTISKEEADALRHCVAILAPICTAHERGTMALNVETRISGQGAGALAFRFTHLARLFHPSDTENAQELAQKMQAAAAAGELNTKLPPNEKGAFITDLAAWTDCPPIPEESPLRYWLPFMPTRAPAQSPATPAPVVTDQTEAVEPSAPAWSLITSLERTPGYRWPLYQFLKAAYVAGKPCPKAQEVLDAWKLNPPPGLKVIQSKRCDALEYQLNHGGIKTADLKAIQAAIDGLIV